jgi:hypothetical protein
VQRQTACIRYISAPQRSHNTLSFWGLTLMGGSGRAGDGGSGSDMAGIIARVGPRVPGLQKLTIR